ncbi:MAG: 6-carboxytetrahydropterin synthase [Leptospirales bacterium]
MGFTVSVRRSFAASHMIPGYPGLCARLHGHNWTVEAAFRTGELDALGMAVDFHEIERLLDPLLREVDHTHLNDHPFFAERTTTAENIALFFYRGLRRSLAEAARPGLLVDRVSVGEMDGYVATYEEP